MTNTGQPNTDTLQNKNKDKPVTNIHILGNKILPKWEHVKKYNNKYILYTT